MAKPLQSSLRNHGAAIATIISRAWPTQGRSTTNAEPTHYWGMRCAIVATTHVEGAHTLQYHALQTDCKLNRFAHTWQQQQTLIANS